MMLAVWLEDAFQREPLSLTKRGSQIASSEELFLNLCDKIKISAYIEAALIF